MQVNTIDSKSLLQACFFETPDHLRLSLQPLGAEQRKQLFALFKEDLQALKAACRFSPEAYVVIQRPGPLPMGQMRPMIQSVQEIWPSVAEHQKDLAGYLNREAICLFAARDAGEFFLKLQILQVALAPQKQLFSGLKAARGHLPFALFQDPGQSPAYLVGRTLLDRPEDWQLQALQKHCSQMGESPSSWGYARLLREALHQHPDWEASLQPFLGQSMFLGGFQDPELMAFPASMILAGLAYLPEGKQNSQPLPLDYAAKALAERLQQADIPRAELIRLTLTQLQSATRPPRAKSWLRFCESLNLTPAEILANRSPWLQLLFAPQPAPLQKAVKVLKPLVIKGLLDADFATLLAAALQGLQHPSPGAAASAWELFRALHQHHPNQQQHMLDELATALAIPHAKVRLQILTWLQKQTLTPTLQTTLTALSLSDSLSALEVDGLQRLVPATSISPTQEPLALPLPSAEQLARLPAFRRSYYQALSSAITENATLDQVLPQSADWHHYCSDPVLELYPDTETLAAAFCQFVQTDLAPLELERLLASTLALPLVPNPSFDQTYLHLRRLLDPVYQTLAVWQQPEAGRELYQMPQRSLHLALLAYGWLHQGRRPDFDQASAPYRTIQYSRPLDFCLLQRVELTLRALAEGWQSLLATPDYTTGWLRPQTLLTRLNQYLAQGDPGLDAEDLGLALLRLPPLTEAERSELWQALPQQQLTHPLQRAALQLALGPAPALTEALQPFADALRRNPPDDWILQSRFYSAQPRDTEPNRNFRLLQRAILARTGLADAQAVLPQITRLRLDQLLINAGLDHSVWNKLSGQVIEEIKQLLLGGTTASHLPPGMQLPKPRQKMLKVGKHPGGPALLQAFWHPGAALPNPFETDDTLRHLLEPHPLPYPQMAAHVIEWLGPLYQPGYGFGFQTDVLVDPLTWHMPVLSQKLWNTAIHSLGQLLTARNPEKHLFAVALLSLGTRPYVTVTATDLAALAPLITSKHPEHRLAVLQVLEALLGDGRVTLGQLVSFWADRLAGPAEGFKYLLEAADEWLAQGSACEWLLLTALEQIWTQGRQPCSRNLPRLLERYAHLLDRYQQAPQEPEARAALQTLASKKSATQTQARLLLQRTPTTHQEKKLLLALAEYVAGRPVTTGLS